MKFWPISQGEALRGGKTIADRDHLVRLAWLARSIGILIALQFAFGIAIRSYTGSALWPPVIESTLIAAGLWLAVPIFVLLTVIVRCDRDAPIASALGIARNWYGRLAGTLLVLLAFGLSFSAINWTKSMIPAFTHDLFLAELDYGLFGRDPWRAVDILPLRNVMALAYVYWFPVIYACLIAACLTENIKALLAVFLLAAIDTAAQFVWPSAGPIFWSRLGYGSRFEALEHGPEAYSRFANYLWSHHEAEIVTAGTGISAMPSMHVALSFWVVLSFQRFRPASVAFFGIIFLASVASGWHYVTDGLAGCVMAYAAHILAGAWVRRAPPKQGRVSR